jgi:hypothetical protein
MKDKIMNLDVNSFSSYIRNNANIQLLKFSQISKYYNDYKISNRKLEELKEEFYVEDLKRKLENSNYSKWAEDENFYIMNYHYELNTFIINIKKPLEILQQQISNINLECEKKSKKYYEKLTVVNDLKSKLEQEIEVKTKYENMLKQLLIARDKNNQKKLNDNIYSNKMNEMQRIQKSEGPNKRKMKFSFNLKKIISRNSNEYDKIMKKLNSINKEIEKNNQILLIEYQKLDKRQNILNEVVNQRDELKKQLDNILNSSEMMKRELIKELFYKLNSI